MKKMVLIVLFVFLSCVMSTPVALGGEERIDVTGEWNITNKFGDGDPTITTHNNLTLQQVGETLTGTNGVEKLQGTVKGRKIQWSEKTEPQHFDLTYKGKLTAPDAMEGSFDFIGRGLTGTWTAKRVKREKIPNKAPEATR